MELDSSQKELVSQWAANGDSLSAIQEKLSSEFGVKMTYMEVRFLVEDLNVELTDDESTDPKEDGETEPSAEESAETVELEDAGFDGAAGSGRVSVSVDKITRPGAVVSGSVTFSDAKSAQWMLDQMGQLRLVPSEEGYQPSEEDIQAFQASLQSELQKQGF
ncbi:MAG: hypothetical protein AAGJ81_03375 [Verrucomicrobiota bacterium]